MDFQFRTSFTGVPADQEKNEKFSAPQIYLTTRSKKSLLISAMVSEKNDFSRVSGVKKNTSADWYFGVITFFVEGIICDQIAWVT